MIIKLIIIIILKLFNTFNLLIIFIVLSILNLLKNKSINSSSIDVYFFNNYVNEYFLGIYNIHNENI